MRSISKLRENGFVIAPATEGVGLIKISAPEGYQFYYYNPKFDITTHAAVGTMMNHGPVDHIFVPASSYDEASNQFPLAILYADEYLAMHRQVADAKDLEAQMRNLRERQTCLEQMQQLYKRDREQ